MHTWKRFSTVLMWVTTVVLCGLISSSAEVKSGTAVIKAVQGSATYVDALGLTHALTVGTVLKEGQTIRTGTDSHLDIFLAENGPGVALEANSVLRLEKLSSQQSVLGTLIDTRLDLRQGKLYGTVDKLLPGSHYEVRMPNGVATVRGTEFFIDAQMGTVFVTSGTVNVTVNLKLDNGENLSRTIAVTAGNELIIPNVMRNQSDFNHLAAIPTPSYLNQAALTILAQLHLLTHYNAPTKTTSVVIESFKGEKEKGVITVDKPPKSIVVSP